MHILIASSSKSGSISSDPAAGSALITSFLIETFGWVESNPDDYPIFYVFTYQLASSLTPMTIQPLSTAASVTTQFPAGLASYNYQLMVSVVASDINNCTSNAVTTTVTVAVDSSVDLSSYLDSNFQSALSSGNVQEAFQTLNNVASTLNNVNCTVATPSYCAALNRDVCVSVPNTCGSCLSGYKGVIGSSNAKCFDSSLSNWWHRIIMCFE